jgi:hypothetical protein
VVDLYSPSRSLTAGSRMASLDASTGTAEQAIRIGDWPSGVAER